MSSNTISFRFLSCLVLFLYFLNFHHPFIFQLRKKKENIIEMRKHFKPNLFFCRLLSESKQLNILRKARSYIKQRKYDEAVSMQALST